MKPLIVRKEIEGYISDRLQEALWRESLHLIKDGIATTDEIDDAIVYGPGLRWAFMGVCLTFHLAGGETGMKHMLEQFGPALKLPWTKLKVPPTILSNSCRFSFPYFAFEKWQPPKKSILKISPPPQKKNPF